MPSAFDSREGPMKREIQMYAGTCNTCHESYDAGQSHCAGGHPTPYASFEERAAYEVAAWRLHQERAAAVA
jgi:hypothetical protein